MVLQDSIRILIKCLTKTFKIRLDRSPRLLDIFYPKFLQNFRNNLLHDFRTFLVGFEEFEKRRNHT